MDRDKRYITDEEILNCQKVADAFAEMYEEEDIVVVDAGRYGFVKLQYFEPPYGFTSVTTFSDSQSLFEDLWGEWLESRLIHWASGTPMEKLDDEDIFQCLPEEKKKEFLGKRDYFLERADIIGTAPGTL